MFLEQELSVEEAAMFDGLSKEKLVRCAAILILKAVDDEL
jgi:hypothetical protein